MDLSNQKAFGSAILGMLVFILVVRLLFIALHEPRNLSRPGYILKGLVVAHPPGAAPLPVEPMPDWRTAIRTANIESGKKLANRCVGCHDFSAANKNKTGPGLYGVMGREFAAQPGFHYSSVLAAKPGRWTLDAMFEFLREPQLYLPGTKMSAAGIENAQERIDLTAHLFRDQSR